MAVAALKRGGPGRFVLKNAAPMDTFTLPAGVRIRSLIAENTLVSGVKNMNIQTFTFTTGTAGTTGVTFDGVTLFTAASEASHGAFGARFAAAFAGGVTGASGCVWNAIPTATQGVVIVYSKPTRYVVSSGLVVGGGVGTIGGLTGAATVAGVSAYGGAPTISIGSTPPVLAVNQFTVTAGVSAAGVILVDGAYIQVFATDTTPALVAARIAASNLWGATNGPWTVTASGATVTMTGIVPKAATVATPSIFVGATGFTVSSVTALVTGVAPGAQLVSGYALPVGAPSTYNGDVTIVGTQNYRPASSLDVGTYVFSGTNTAGQTFTLGNTIVTTTSTTSTQIVIDAAAKINAIPGYVASSTGSTLTIIVTDTQKTIPQFNNINLSSMTCTTSFVGKDIQYWLTYGATTAALIPTVIGNLDLYVQTEKYV